MSRKKVHILNGRVVSGKVKGAVVKFLSRCRRRFSSAENAQKHENKKEKCCYPDK